MKRFAKYYETLLRSSFALSGRLEIGGEPSALRACLFVSAAQVLNISAFFYIYEVASKREWSHTGLALFAVSVCILVFNLVYFEAKKSSLVSESNRSFKREQIWPIISYYVFSIVLFVLSAVLLYRSGL